MHLGHEQYNSPAIWEEKMLLRTFFNITGDKLYENLQCVTRGVNRRQVLEIFPGYNEHECWLLSKETKGKQNQMNILAILIANRKIPKISPGAYIFQRSFLRGLFVEGPIFGGAYLRREICVSNSIGLAL